MLGVSAPLRWLLSTGAHLPPLAAIICAPSPAQYPQGPAAGAYPHVHQAWYHGSVLRMAGHSHWANISRKKAAADQEKSKVIAKMTSKIVTAVQLGGGSDPDKNVRLAAIISQARGVGIPKSTIEGAVQSGTRQMSGQGAKPVLFEGRGPDGFLILIETLTTKTSRTRQEIRAILEKHGGGLGEPGSSSFVFEHKGIVQIPREELAKLASCNDPLELATEVGAEDVIQEEDDAEHVLLKCEPSEMRGVVRVVKEKGLTVSSATLEYLPQTPVCLPPKACQRAEKLLELLSQHSDVADVHSNFVSELPS